MSPKAIIIPLSLGSNDTLVSSLYIIMKEICRREIFESELSSNKITLRCLECDTSITLCTREDLPLSVEQP